MELGIRKYCIRFILVLVAFQQVLGTLDPDRELSQYSMVQWNLEDGLPSNWVVAIYQIEDDPALWIGTPTGLARFNGVEFNLENWRNHDNFKEGAWAFGRDDQGRLCVGTKNQGVLVRGETGEFTLTGTENLEVRNLITDHQGRMWIGTPRGLFLRGKYELESVSYGALENAFVTAIYEDFAGNIWIGTQDDGLFVIGPEPNDEMLQFSSEKTIYSIQSDAKNRLWVGGKDGISVYDAGQEVFHFTVDDGLPSNTVRALHLDSVGCLWIGTENGIIRAKDDRLIPNKAGSPFDGDFITCFFEDQEGSLWVGSKYQGFAQIWTGKFTVYSEREGLENEVVNVAYEDYDKLLIGTNSGLYSICDGRVQVEYGETLGDLRIRDVFRDSHGSLWVCTYSGLYCINPNGHVKLLGVDQGLPSSLVRQTLEDRNGNLWVGTRSGLAMISDSGVKTWISPELRNDLILHIYEDRGGRIWIATDGGGIACYENGAFRWFTKEDGLANDVVFKIYQDMSGIYWLATANGISIFDGINIQNIGSQDGLPSNAVFQIMEDSQGWIWLTANEGVYRIKKSVLGKYLATKDMKPLEFQRFGLLDGLKTYQMTGVGESCVLRDGSICLATAKGVAVLNRSEASDYRSNPSVYIESITVNGEFIEIPVQRNALNFEIGPGVKRLEIKYTSTSLISAKTAMFSTQLKGFDESYSDSNDRKVVYTNLNPGVYHFLSRTKGNDGNWSEPHSGITFVVKPYLIQRKWFIGVFFLPFALVVYGIYRFRTLQLRHQRSELEKKVRERTNEISRQKEIIEQKNTEIEKNNRDLQHNNAALKKLSEEKSYLLGIAAHDIRNPLGNIVSLSEELKITLGAGNQHAGELVDLIKDSGEHLLDLLKSILQSIAVESGSVLLNREKEDLVQLLDSVVNVSFSYAAEKQQRIIVSCPGKIIGYVDGLRIRTAMDNYISNAIKYSPENSEIRILLQESLIDGIRWAVFEVSDEGPGLNEDDFKHVFGRYATLSAKPTGNEISTGMGLSIVKQTVEDHGGKVGVENNPYKGAAFFFKIPLQT